MASIGGSPREQGSGQRPGLDCLLLPCGPWCFWLQLRRPPEACVDAGVWVAHHLSTLTPASYLNSFPLLTGL